MKLHLDLEHGTLNYELEPMPPERFKALCVLVAGGLYIALVAVTGKLCGLAGVGIVAALTLLCGLVWVFKD